MNEVRARAFVGEFHAHLATFPAPVVWSLLVRIDWRSEEERIVKAIKRVIERKTRTAIEIGRIIISVAIPHAETAVIPGAVEAHERRERQADVTVRRDGASAQRMRLASGVHDVAFVAEQGDDISGRIGNAHRDVIILTSKAIFQRFLAQGEGLFADRLGGASGLEDAIFVVRATADHKAAEKNCKEVNHARQHSRPLHRVHLLFRKRRFLLKSIVTANASPKPTLRCNSKSAMGLSPHAKTESRARNAACRGDRRGAG